MTYNLPITNLTKNVGMNILLVKTNNSGNISTNDIVDLNTTAIYNNTTNTIINSNNIVLSSGHYLIECCLGIANSNSINNNAEWNILVDDVEQNTKGSSAQLGKVGVDGSVATVSFNGGSKTIKIKITSVSGTCSINNDYSYIIIKQVDL
tara:strand:- start:48 stop:497 length:450 start_codon:yes stop_codon:yes gene_type:complete